MIPKIIHYCWLSQDAIPGNLQRCIDSWHRLLPDYEFVLWNFDRFPKHQSGWVAQAFDNRKYAFAADYIRLYALYNYGGIYLDMDVEVVQSFNPLLALSTMLCWQKGADGLEVATFGTEKGAQWVRHCLDYYEGRSFVQPDGTLDTTPLPNIVENVLRQQGYTLALCHSIAEATTIESCGSPNTLPVLTAPFFSPRSYDNAKLHITANTYSIHHFAGTWLPWYSRAKRSIYNALGLTNQSPLQSLKHLIGIKGRG